MMKNDIKKKNSYSPSIPIGLLLLGMMGVSTQTRAVEAHGEDVVTTMKTMKRDEDPRADENNGQAKRNNILGRAERNKILAIAKKFRPHQGEHLQKTIDLISDGEAHLPLKNTTAHKNAFNKDYPSNDEFYSEYDGYWDKYCKSIEYDMSRIDAAIKKGSDLIKLLETQLGGNTEDKISKISNLDNDSILIIKEYKEQAEGVYDLLRATKENALDHRIPLYRLAPLWAEVDSAMYHHFSTFTNVNLLVSDLERAIRLNSSLSSKELQEAVENLKKSTLEISFDGEKYKGDGYADYDRRGFFKMLNKWSRIMSLIRFSEKSKNEIEKELNGTNSPDDTLAFWN